jgi:hypothetical protein
MEEQYAQLEPSKESKTGGDQAFTQWMQELTKPGGDNFL